MIMSTFAERHDFAGKTVLPVTTHAMSGLGSTPEHYARVPARAHRHRPCSPRRGRPLGRALRRGMAAAHRPPGSALRLTRGARFSSSAEPQRHGLRRSSPLPPPTITDAQRSARSSVTRGVVPSSHLGSVAASGGRPRALGPPLSSSPGPRCVDALRRRARRGFARRATPPDRPSCFRPTAWLQCEHMFVGIPPLLAHRLRRAAALVKAFAFLDDHLPAARPTEPSRLDGSRESVERSAAAQPAPSAGALEHRTLRAAMPLARAPHPHRRPLELRPSRRRPGAPVAKEQHCVTPIAGSPRPQRRTRPLQDPRIS